jgi:membrane protease YdiL (CAAX protease family)
MAILTSNRSWPELPSGYVIAVLLAVSACEIGVAMIFANTEPQAELVVLRIAELALMAGLIRHFCMIDSLGLTAPDRHAWRLFLVIAAVCAFAVLALLFALSAVGISLPAYLTAPTWVSGATGIMLMLLLAPLAEELFFRGLVYRLLCQSFGQLAAVLLSATCFALMHGKLFSPQLAGGVIFALAYQHSRNLWIAVALHAGGNAAVLAITFLSHNAGF